MEELTVGSTVAGCRIEGVAGRGGMGVVYRARQVALDRAVALKAIRPEVAASTEYQERFRREARLAAAIEHPNVVPVYEAGESGGVLYLVMRWVPGTDLRALIAERGGLAPERAVALLAPVAEALDAAHRGGLVHRDVKPANVLVSEEGDRERSWLTDFGIARTYADTRGAMTRAGAVVGTFDYIAPERIEGGRGDAASDVYAYGCVLYEALTGRVPFPAPSEVALMHAHLNTEPPAPSEQSPGVPPALDSVVANAMAKRPEARFPSAHDAAEATRAALGAPPPASTRAQPGGAGPRARPGRRRAALIGAAIVALAAAAAVVAALGGGGDEQSGSGAQRTGVGAPIPVPGADGIAAAAGSVWVAAGTANALVRIDERRRRVIGRFPVGRNPDSVAVAADVVWVTLTDDDAVRRVRADGSGPLGGAIAVGSAPEGVAVESGTVWVANSGSGTVSRLDAGSGRPRGPALTVGGGPTGVTAFAGSVWVSNSADGTVSRIDPGAGRVTATIQVGGEPRAVAGAAGRLWAADSRGGAVVPIDPASNRAGARVAVGADPRALAAEGSTLWVPSAGESTLVRVDARAGRVAGRVRLPLSPLGAAVAGGTVWTTSVDGDAVLPYVPPR